MTGPTVSVVIPVRDEERYLPTALRSIAEQRGDPTLGEIEVVVVDDHSGDWTVEVAQGFDGVRVVPVEGSGIPDALNTGLRHARAPIVARLDADDLYVPGALRTLVEALRSDPTLTIVSGGASEVGADGTLLGYLVPLPTTPHLRLSMMLECPFTHSASAYRRDRIVELGGYRVQPNGDMVGEDYDLWERVLAAGDEVRGLADLICERRIRPDSVTVHRRVEMVRTETVVRARATTLWAHEYDRTGRLVRLGRDLDRYPEPMAIRGRFQYTLLRLAVAAVVRGEMRRTLALSTAALMIGPWTLLQGTVRAKRGHVMERVARGRSALRRW